MKVKGLAPSNYYMSMADLALKSKSVHFYCSVRNPSYLPDLIHRYLNDSLTLHNQ